MSVEKANGNLAQVWLLQLAAELRALREKSGKSLRELQQPTFASDSSLSRYLSGQTLPPWQVVEALCRLGGRDPRELRPTWELARGARSEQARMTRARPTSAPPPVVVTPPPRRRLDPRVLYGLLLAAAVTTLVGALLRRRRSPVPV